jgi:hypothetical protein
MAASLADLIKTNDPNSGRFYTKNLGNTVGAFFLP